MRQKTMQRNVSTNKTLPQQKHELFIARMATNNIAFHMDFCINWSERCEK